jgi:hypothetical protein
MESKQDDEEGRWMDGWHTFELIGSPFSTFHRIGRVLEERRAAVTLTNELKFIYNK